jgi:hypothetical protein
VGEVPASLILVREKVKTGAQASVVEQVDDHSVTWIFVEAMVPRMSTSEKALSTQGFWSTRAPVLKSWRLQSVHHSSYEGRLCQYLLSASHGTWDKCGVSLCLAFVLSGDQWTATDVKTDDPADAPAIGVYRFTKETGATLIATP